MEAQDCHSCYLPRFHNESLEDACRMCVCVKCACVSVTYIYTVDHTVAFIRTHTHTITLVSRWQTGSSEANTQQQKWAPIRTLPACSPCTSAQYLHTDTQTDRRQSARSRTSPMHCGSNSHNYHGGKIWTLEPVPSLTNLADLGVKTTLILSPTWQPLLVSEVQAWLKLGDKVKTRTEFLQHFQYIIVLVTNCTL